MDRYRAIAMVIPLHDDNPTERFPFVTVAIIALNVLVYLFVQPHSGVDSRLGTSRDTALSATRAVLRSCRKISWVSRSPASTSRSLTFWWISDSTVAMNRVPLLIPCAPRARALITSLPRRKPLSTMTVMRFPTASITSGSTSIGARELSR